jgi:hypothetical protein
VKPAAMLLAVVGFSALTACDPGYQFRVHNPCDTPVKATFLDSDQFDRTAAMNGRLPATLPPHSDTSWSTLDRDINPPFGVFLVSGPRAGEIIQSATPEVTIPESACPV